MIGTSAAFAGKEIAGTPFSKIWEAWLALLLVGSLSLLPVYLFPSGGYQIADLPLALTILSALLFRTEQNTFSKYLLWFVPFMAWAFLINSLQLLRYSDIWPAKATAMLVYGPVISFALAKVFVILLRKGFIPYAYCGALASVLACLFAKGGEETGRVALSFNDPNQLGYFGAVLQGYILILRGFRKRSQIRSVWYDLADAFTVLFAHIFLALSFSRSAMGAFLFLDLCLFKNMLKDPKESTGFWVLLFLSPIYFTLIDTEFIQSRLEVRPHHFESEAFFEVLKERITKPLAAMKGLQIVTGTGAGLGDQAEEEIVGTATAETEEVDTFLVNLLESYGPVAWRLVPTIEAHNLFADLFRAYGVIGLALFVPWLFKLIWDTRRVPDALWVWMGLMTYNMGNNGIRFRSLWILIALIVAVEGLRSKSS
jgi:hypothetical protein